MLAIRNLTFYLKKDLRVLLNDFSFVLSEPRKVALIGEEGSGKSTLLKAIAEPESIADFVDMTGRIEVGDDMIGYLPQRSSGELMTRSTAAMLNEVASPEAFDYRLFYRLVAELEFDESLISPGRFFGQLSGGEKIKYRLLLAMMREPTLLLLDEPTNDLDLDSIGLMERFIRTVDVPVLFVSHDERLLQACADTIIHIEQQVHRSVPVHTIAACGYDEYVSNRLARIDRQTRLANKEKAEFDAKIARFHRVRERVQHELRTVSRGDPQAAKNLKDKMRSVTSMGRRFERERQQLTKKPVTDDVIDIAFGERSGLHRRRRVLELRLPELRAGDRLLSRHVELTLIGNTKTCIIGANGSGKTTLLRRVVNEMADSDIRFFYMPQNYEEELGLSANAVRYLTTDHTKTEHTKIRTYLGSLNFTPEEMARPIASLSGGQKCKLCFAKMILGEYDFLILDEPTRNLSPLSAPEVRRALREYGGGVLAVSHDRALIDEVFDEVFVLSEEGLAPVFLT